MNDLIKYNLNKTCRACLSPNVHLKDLHKYKIFVGLNFITKFEFCTKIKVSETDNLPLKMCINCVEKLNAACSFIQLCQGSDVILRKISLNNNVEVESLDKNVQTECSDANIDILSSSNSVLALTKSQSHNDNICHICSKSYRTVGHLKLHLKLHSSNANDGYSCNMCSKKFTQKGALVNHMKKHDRLKKGDEQRRDSSLVSEHACRVCYKTFDSRGMWSAHLRNDHTKREKLECQLCQKTLKTNASALKHFKLHMGDKKNDMFNVTKWISFVDTHKENITNINVEKVDGENVAADEVISDNCHLESKSYSCSKCDKSFVHRSSLSLHLKKHNVDNNNGFYCKICNCKFKLLAYLKEHEKIHNEDKKYSCTTCLKKYHRKNSLNRHMLNHVKELSYLCYKCGFTAKNYSAYKLHMLKHNGVLAYSCNVCQKKFPTKSSLKSHGKVHTGIKKYKCSLCPKRYVNSTGMKYHMQAHHGVQKQIKPRPYQCRECGKAFETEKNLQIHIVMHTGDFPHVCHICEQGFNRFANYKVHMQRHTGVKSFICDICGFAVFSASALKIHNRKHTGEKPYQCDSCQHKFATSGGLLRHKTRLHTNLQKNYTVNLQEDICNLDNYNANNADVKYIPEIT